MRPITAKFLVTCDVHFDADTGQILACVPDKDELERTMLDVVDGTVRKTVTLPALRSISVVDEVG